MNKNESVSGVNSRESPTFLLNCQILTKYSCQVSPCIVCMCTCVCAHVCVHLCLYTHYLSSLLKSGCPRKQTLLFSFHCVFPCVRMRPKEPNCHLSQCYGHNSLSHCLCPFKVSYKQWKFIFHSSGSWEVQLRHWQIW
jgi:hypothetical protein